LREGAAIARDTTAFPRNRSIAALAGRQLGLLASARRCLSPLDRYDAVMYRIWMKDDVTAAASTPGRPRSREVDEAIVRATIDLFIQRGAAGTSIEQVAQRAGVTRATVYRRYATRTELLLASVEAIRIEDDPEQLAWPSIEAMVADWAEVLARPRNRRLVRRLYGSIDDYPELLQAYGEANGRHRVRATRAALERARDEGRLPADADVEVIQQLLSGAVLHHLGTAPDDVTREHVERFLSSVLRQIGYREPVSGSLDRTGP